MQQTLSPSLAERWYLSMLWNKIVSALSKIATWWLMKTPDQRDRLIEIFFWILLVVAGVLVVWFLL